MAVRSPVTLPGHRAGQAPANAGLILPPKTFTSDDPLALLFVPFMRTPVGVRSWALFAIFSLHTTAVSLPHIAAGELVETMGQRNWSTP
jgi:hypothetical protein